MSTALQKQNTSSNRPALRLVKTNDLSRDDWLEVRKTGIGSSDAAAAVGLNPYKSYPNQIRTTIPALCFGARCWKFSLRPTIQKRPATGFER
jgi:hypothetical protein